MLSIDKVCGLDDASITTIEGLALHEEVVHAWRALCSAAADNGYALRGASGYRSFARQLTIWNEKACGKRTLLDSDENPVDPRELSTEECMWNILSWSALPGSSRHHWGTEIDIYDVSAIPKDYQIQLTLAEIEQFPRLQAFYSWLEDYLPCSDFFRPYSGANAFSREPWHLSYRPVSQQFEKAQDRASMLAFYKSRSDILLLDEIVGNFDCIYERYISI